MVDNNNKFNMKVLIITLVLLFGFVIYFAVFNKEDVPDNNITTKVYVESVEITRPKITINIGDTDTIDTIIIPKNATNKKVSWISNNDTVVRVDENGNITGVSVGKATITVKTEDGKRTSSCVVNVIDPEKTVVDNVVDVVGVSLNNTEMALLKGSSYKLIANVKPNDATNKDVSWASSNPSVATVDSNGKITGVSVGKATITVKTKDGNKTAKCVVTVSNLVVAVTEISLDETDLVMTVGSNKKLNVTITPSNATYKTIGWKSSNPDVVKVDRDGKLTAVGLGKSIITAQALNDNKTAKCEVTVTN